MQNGLRLRISSVVFLYFVKPNMGTVGSKQKLFDITYGCLFKMLYLVMAGQGRGGGCEQVGYLHNVLCKLFIVFKINYFLCKIMLF